MINRTETELKLELNAQEFEDCQQKLLNLGCKKIKTSALSDYFFDIKKFDEKGWDFTRIRVYDDKDYEKTTKIWKLNEKKERIREEIEEKSSKLELDDKISIGNYLKANKTRTDYSGTVLDYPTVFSFDKIVFPDETRYFLEAELEGVPADDSDSIRPKIKMWLLDNLQLSDRAEGIGMMKLVLIKTGMI